MSQFTYYKGPSGGIYRLSPSGKKVYVKNEEAKKAIVQLTPSIPPPTLPPQPISSKQEEKTYLPSPISSNSALAILYGPPIDNPWYAYYAFELFPDEMNEYLDRKLTMDTNTNKFYNWLPSYVHETILAAMSRDQRTTNTRVQVYARRGFIPREIYAQAPTSPSLYQIPETNKIWKAIAGVVSMTEMQGVDMHGYIFGDMHERQGGCIGPDVLPIVEFFDVVAKENLDKMFDAYLEEILYDPKQVVPGVRMPYYQTSADQGYMLETSKTYQKCFTKDKYLCPIRNMRFHYIDIRQIGVHLNDMMWRCRQIHTLVYHWRHYAPQTAIERFKMEFSPISNQLKDETLEIGYDKLIEEARINKEMKGLSPNQTIIMKQLVEEYRKEYRTLSILHSITSSLEKILSNPSALHKDITNYVNQLGVWFKHNFYLMARFQDFYTMARLLRSPPKHPSAQAHHFIIFVGDNHAEFLVKTLQERFGLTIRAQVTHLQENYLQCLPLDAFRQPFFSSRQNEAKRSTTASIPLRPSDQVSKAPVLSTFEAYRNATSRLAKLYGVNQATKIMHEAKRIGNIDQVLATYGGGRVQEQERKLTAPQEPPPSITDKKWLSLGGSTEISTNCLSNYTWKASLPSTIYGPVFQLCQGKDCNFELQIINEFEDLDNERQTTLEQRIAITRKLGDAAIGPTVMKSGKCEMKQKGEIKEAGFVILERLQMTLAEYARRFPSLYSSQRNEIEKQYRALMNRMHNELHVIHWGLTEPESLLLDIGFNWLPTRYAILNNGGADERDPEDEDFESYVNEDREDLASTIQNLSK